MEINKQAISLEHHSTDVASPETSWWIGSAFYTAISLVSRFWWLLTLAMLGVITYLSLSGPPPINLSFSLGDKVMHMLAYACLVIPVALAKPRYWFVYIVGLLLCGGAIELIQPWFARQMDIWDLVANASGLLVGYLSVRFLNLLIERR